MNLADVFSHLRQMSGGALTQDQVDAGDKIVQALGVETLAVLLAYDEFANASKISDRGIKTIHQFESFRANAYQDSAGVWTIGYGTIRYPNGVAVKRGDVCTKEQAEQWFRSDLKWVEQAIAKNVKVTLNQNQYDALCSFIYNLGEGNFVKSTLLRYLNSGDYIGASGQFGRFVNAGGKFVQGLANRRAMEVELFNTPV